MTPEGKNSLVRKGLISVTAHSQNYSDPFRGFGGTEEKWHLFQMNREQRPTVEENRGTKTILGTCNIRKHIFDFGGNRRISQLISGEQRT